VEERLAPFGVTVIRVARRARDGVHGIDELDGLLPQADAVLVLVPLTDDTRSMVDDALISQMKPGAALVLASRGEVADTDAILRAVNDGRIRAGLDVVDPAPLPPDHPLWTAPNVFITPHIGGRSPGLYPRLATLIEAQIERFVRGEPLVNVVENGY
jgi:phosphoglycerate dehydrogenase-like enzyme